MREIKFRAWLDYGDGSGEMLPNIQNHINGKWAFGHIVNGSVDGVSQPMQYTGIKDKNGVEIYEGDIVKSEQEKHYWMSVISSESGLGGVNLYAMEFCNNVSVSECGGFYTYERQPSVRRNNIHSRMEVIGNIHQNPELLD